MPIGEIYKESEKLYETEEAYEESLELYEQLCKILTELKQSHKIPHIYNGL